LWDQECVEPYRTCIILGTVISIHTHTYTHAHTLKNVFTFCTRQKSVMPTGSYSDPDVA
jgi:hypothetical protein